MKPSTIIAKTIKWEARRWYEHFFVFLIIAAVCVVVLFLLPVPGESWHTAARTVVFWLYCAAIAPFALAIYMLVVYPVISIVVYPTFKSMLLERGSGVSSAYSMFTRFAFSIATAAIGVGIISVTVTALHPLTHIGNELLSGPAQGEQLFGPDLAITVVTFTGWIPVLILSVLTQFRLNRKNHLHEWLLASANVLCAAVLILQSHIPIEWLRWTVFLALPPLIMVYNCFVMDRHSNF